MSFVNWKCIVMVVLACVAAWQFPWGLAIDACIVGTWFWVRSKRKQRAIRKEGVSTTAQDQNATSAAAINLLAATMLAGSGQLPASVPPSVAAPQAGGGSRSKDDIADAFRKGMLD